MLFLLLLGVRGEQEEADEAGAEGAPSSWKARWSSRGAVSERRGSLGRPASRITLAMVVRLARLPLQSKVVKMLKLSGSSGVAEIHGSCEYRCAAETCVATSRFTCNYTAPLT